MPIPSPKTSKKATFVAEQSAQRVVKCILWGVVLLCVALWCTQLNHKPVDPTITTASLHSTPHKQQMSAEDEAEYSKLMERSGEWRKDYTSFLLGSEGEPKDVGEVMYKKLYGEVGFGL